MKDNTIASMTVLVVICLVIYSFSVMCSIDKKIDASYSNDESWTAYLEVRRPLDEVDSLSTVAQLDTVRWAEFLECSKDEGDMGCDSCFTMIYGYSLEFK